MNWIEKLEEYKKQVNELEYEKSNLSYQSIKGINTELVKHLWPVARVHSYVIRLKNHGTERLNPHTLTDEYKRYKFEVTKQETLEIIAEVELLLHKLTEGNYHPKP